jgi:hypothetical protein
MKKVVDICFNMKYSISIDNEREIDMTDFIKSEFQTSGDQLRYAGKFVARFKHKRGPVTKAKFLKELIANHTVESYFAAMQDGNAPFGILRDANENWFYGLLGMK